MNKVPKVYVSYAWNNHDGSGPDRETIVDEIRKALEKKNFQLIQDKKGGLPYGESITQFMRDIAAADYVLVVLSEKSLISDYCMTEVAWLTSTPNWQKKCLPVILPDANIFDEKKCDHYVDYWEQRKITHDRRMNERGAKISPLDMELQTRINLINTYLKVFISTMVDTNAKSPELLREGNFEDILNRINGSMRQKNDDQTQSFGTKGVFVTLVICLLLAISGWFISQYYGRQPIEVHFQLQLENGNVLRLMPTGVKTLELDYDAHALPGKENVANCHFRYLDTPKEGDRFQMQVNLNRNSFVYVLNCNSQNKWILLFPNRVYTQAFVQADTNLRVPGDKAYFRFTDETQVDLLCVLVSPTELESTKLATQLESATGTPMQRIYHIFGQQLAGKLTISDLQNVVQYEKSDKIVPVFIALAHE